MHTFDSLARTMVAPRPKAARRTPVLLHLVPLTCALLPLGVMMQAWWLTA